VVLKSVPSGATVVVVPGRTVEDHRKNPLKLEHGKLPHPVAEAIRHALSEQEGLRKRLRRLENLSGLAIPDDESKEKEGNYQ